MRQSFYAVFILLAIFSMVGLILLESKWNMDESYGVFNNTKEEMPVLEEISQEKCRLPYDKNPWDKSIMPVSPIINDCFVFFLIIMCGIFFISTSITFMVIKNTAITMNYGQNLQMEYFKRQRVTIIVGEDVYTGKTTMNLNRVNGQTEPNHSNVMLLKPDAPPMETSRSRDWALSLVQDILIVFVSTSWFEDWGWGWSNWPDCIGNLEKPAEHMNSPFRLAWTAANNASVKNLIKKQNYCASKHQLMMDHVGQFLKAYKGIPKMTTIFDNDWGHDAVSTSVEADEIIHDFFIKNREILKNSFIFLMADHGLRIGPATSTKMGQLEINNPMLYVIPPADLAKNKEFMDVLRENSQKLQTHMDLRETLFDIMKHQPASNFSDRKPRNDNPHGNSLLRVQNGERSCRTLPIPLQYCICEYKKTELDQNTESATKIGQVVTSEVNLRLDRANVSNKCLDWVFDKVTVLTKLDVVDNMDIYNVEINVEPNAKFRTMVTDLRNGTFLVGTLDRADRYGSRGDCVEGKYRLLCDCRPKV